MKLISELFHLLDEQASVGFTGRVNILHSDTKGIFGSISMLEGDVVAASFKGLNGLKAYYSLIADVANSQMLQFIVEPEIFSGAREISYPYNVLKLKAGEVMALTLKNQKLRPQDSIKLLIDPNFITSGDMVSGDEYSLLTTISDYNLVKDIYKNSELLDYQITNALVSLRQKKALKVIKRNEG